jgi:hypothetical protein
MLRPRDPRILPTAALIRRHTSVKEWVRFQQAAICPSTDSIRYDDLMFRAIIFCGLITSAFAIATLDVLVNASCEFFGYYPAATRTLEMLQSNPSPAELAEKTIDHAEAK